MIANRGAVTAALEPWNERRRGIFYPKTDFDFDLETLRQRKNSAGEAALPRLRSLIEELGEEVASIQFQENAGTCHALYLVQTNRRKLYFKAALEAPAFGFTLEAWAMRKLRQLGLPSLEISAFDVLTHSIGVPFLLVEAARGQALRELENPETQAMPEPLLFELGKTLAAIHQVQCKGAGLLDPGSLEKIPSGLHQTWRDYIQLNLAQHIHTCRDIGAINDVESGEIEKAFDSPVLETAPIQLLHGDPGHHNLFTNGAGITAIIDWEDALAGDPVFDIAYWGTFVRDEMRARFLDGYGLIAKLPADFEQRYWLYYLRVAVSKTVHRHRFGAKDRPGRPPASRRIQKALSYLNQL